MTSHTDTSPLVWQPTLLSAAEPAVDGSFAALERHHLDDEAWVDHVPGWLTGDAALFDWLTEHAGWGQPEIVLYGERKTSPRLVARLAPDGLPPALADARRLL